jgi:hypothetical protein
MMRKIYRSRTIQCIAVVGIALFLVAGVVSFTQQRTAAHAQAPGQQLAVKSHSSNRSHSSTRGCSAVDGITSGDVDEALDQCGVNGSSFKATVIDWNATTTSIKAGLQGHGMPYTNQCLTIACSTPQFPANAGDSICYQASAGTTQADVECYTIPANSNGSTTPILKG